MPSLEFPRLRWPLDLRLEEVGQEQVLLFTCPLGISQPLALIEAVAPVIWCFNGSMSVTQILERFGPQGLQVATLNELITLLEQNLYLDTEPFQRAYIETKRQFAESSERPAALAGRAYAATRLDLSQELTRYLLDAGPAAKPVSNAMIGLVAPHIDYRRGQVCYAKTYRFLGHENHDLYILMGTSHQYSDLLFHLTQKDFLSPLGSLRCNREFVQQLAQAYGYQRSFADEFLHKQEHSLELQLPFLQHLKESPQIVPILVGSFHRMVQAGKLPSEYDEYESFAGAFAELVSKRRANGGRICFIAGVDMAHVGQSFGDKSPLTPQFMEQIAQRDAVYLEALRQRDTLKLFKHIAEDGDARRICGFPTMYTVMDICRRANINYEAVTYDYRQAVDYKTDCAVTFAGMGFYVQ